MKKPAKSSWVFADILSSCPLRPSRDTTHIFVLGLSLRPVLKLLASNLARGRFGETICSDQGSVRALAEGSLRAVCIRASVVHDLLVQTSAKERKITVSGVMSFLQGLTQTQIDKIHADGGSVYSVTAEKGDIFYLPAGYLVAMRPLNNDGVHGLRFVTLHDSPAARADLAHYQKMLLEGNDLDKTEALVVA